MERERERKQETPSVRDINHRSTLRVTKGNFISLSVLATEQQELRLASLKGSTGNGASSIDDKVRQVPPSRDDPSRIVARRRIDRPSCRTKSAETRSSRYKNFLRRPRTGPWSLTMTAFPRVLGSEGLAQGRRRRRRRRRCVTRARPVHARAAAHASSSPLLRGARIFGEGEG